MKPRVVAVLDGLRILLGAALLLDVLRAWRTPDASVLGLLVRWPGGLALPVAAGALLGSALLLTRRMAAVAIAPFAVLAAINVVECYRLMARGLSAAPIPFSLIVCAFLAWSCARCFHRGEVARWPWKVAGAAAGGAALVFVHMLIFGATDYTRPADAIVVFGAGVHPDGTPSDALADRVQHAIGLYHSGVAPVLVVSGGANEVSAMRRMAIDEGVPASAIESDPAGVNTLATLRNLRHRRVVAVSHYYHLARIKLTARRLGIECATVPCHMSRPLMKTTYFLARECVAFAAYYLRVASP